MSTVVMHAVTSLDGCIADENDEVGPLFDWYFNGDRPIVDEPLEQPDAPFCASSTRSRWMWFPWSSARAGDTSAASTAGICWKILTS